MNKYGGYSLVNHFWLRCAVGTFMLNHVKVGRIGAFVAHGCAKVLAESGR